MWVRNLQFVLVMRLYPCYHTMWHLSWDHQTWDSFKTVPFFDWLMFVCFILFFFENVRVKLGNFVLHKHNLIHLIKLLKSRVDYFSQVFPAFVYFLPLEESNTMVCYLPIHKQVNNSYFKSLFQEVYFNSDVLQMRLGELFLVGNEVCWHLLDQVPPYLIFNSCLS